MLPLGLSFLDSAVERREFWWLLGRPVLTLSPKPLGSRPAFKKLKIHVRVQISSVS